MNTTTHEMAKILNHVFGGSGSVSASYTPLTTWYLGLSTTEIGTTGSNVTEPSDPSYARVSITNSKANWSWATTTASVITTASFAFPQSSQSQGYIRSVFLADASAVGAGSVCYFYTADPVFPVATATTITFTAGQITANMT